VADGSAENADATQIIAMKAAKQVRGMAGVDSQYVDSSKRRLFENDEILMTNDETSPNDKIQFVGRLGQTLRRFAETPYNYSGFVIPSSFDIRASSL
jgi:hypothetical protein